MSESPKSPIIKGRRSKKRDMEAEIIPATPEKLQPKSLFKVRREERLKSRAMERQQEEMRRGVEEKEKHDK